MPLMSRASSLPWAWCVLAASVAWAHVGFAGAESTQQCLDAYDSAQRMKRAGHLLEAQEKLVYCASSECPELMHRDCEAWLAEVEASIATVVFQVKDPSGATSMPAQVAIDAGEPLSLDGRALSLDPGKHQVTFSARGMQSLSRVYVFAEGDKLRHETVVLQPVARPAAPAMTARHDEGNGQRERPGFALTLPMVLAGTVALAGAAGFAYFGLTARAEDRDLGRCAPECTRDRVTDVKRDYLLANLSLGVGATGLGVCAVLVALAAARPTASPRTSIGLAPQPPAHWLAVSGRF
jgi:hypothetical protein